MHRLTNLAHRAARRHAKRIRAAERPKGQEQLPCVVANLLEQELGYLTQQLQLSRHNQHNGSMYHEHLPQQHGCHQQCLTAGLILTRVLSRQIRPEHAPTPARHFSASAKGPQERQYRAEQPHRQASQHSRQPAGHISHRHLQQPWQQPSASAQSGTVSAAVPQQSRPVSATAPGAETPGQRPQQDSLDWAEAGPSKSPAQGLGVEGDADVRVVSEDKTHRVMPMSAALKLAKRERMDLLPVAPNARPPVFRLGDANEAAKQARLRERDMRRREMENRRKTLMKEVKIGPNTQENDLRMKLDKAKEMVQKLYRVRLFIPYRMKDREAAIRMLQRLREICTDFANVAGPEGIEKLPANTVVVYLSPKT